MKSWRVGFARFGFKLLRNRMSIANQTNFEGAVQIVHVNFSLKLCRKSKRTHCLPLRSPHLGVSVWRARMQLHRHHTYARAGIFSIFENARDGISF